MTSDDESLSVGQDREEGNMEGTGSGHVVSGRRDGVKVGNNRII